MNNFILKPFSINRQTVKGYFLAKDLPFLLGLVSGFSIFYFLYFFQAYGFQKGLSFSGHSHLFRSISFGILTFVHFTFFESIFNQKWHLRGLKYNLVWYFILVVLGSQFIFILFNFFWNWQEWNIEAYLLIMKEFPLMMVLPLTIYFTFITLIKSKKIDKDFLSFQSINGKDHLKIKLHDFLYANASENYITISFKSEKGVKQHLIRKPLKVLEQELKIFPEILRCHRSYLVNRLNIESINHSNGKIFIGVVQDSLPVSKQYREQFID